MKWLAIFTIWLGLPGCGGDDHVSRVTLADIPEDTATDIKEAISATFAETPKEQAKALKYLEQMGTRSAASVPFLLRLIDNRRASHNKEIVVSEYASSALWSIGPLAADAIIAEWECANSEQRILIASNLAPDPRVIEPLTCALKDNDSEIRKGAVWRLGQIPSPDVIPHLIAVLDDSDAKVREAAANALSHRIEGDFRAFKPLLARLTDPTENEFVRCRAAHALGVSRDPRAVGPLLDLLSSQSKSSDLRDEGIFALGCTDSDEALPLLITAVRNKQEQSDFRVAAAMGLSRMTDPRAAETLLGLLREPIHGVPIIEVLCGSGPATVKEPQTIKILAGVLDGNDDDRWIRAWAQYGLARSEMPAAYKRAVEALQDRDQFVRTSSIGVLALGHRYQSLFNPEETVPALSDPSVVEPLIAVLENKKDVPKMRRLAVIALRKTADPRAVPPLIAALKDPKAEVRLEAAKALGQIEDARAVEGLQNARKDEDEVVRTAALIALCKMGKVDHYPADELTLDSLKAATRGYWE